MLNLVQYVFPAHSGIQYVLIGLPSPENYACVLRSCAGSEPDVILGRQILRRQGGPSRSRSKKEVTAGNSMEMVWVGT